MSESSFPFQGQTSVMDAQGQEPLEGGRNRNKVLALAGLGALLVVALVAGYFLVFAGGDDELPEGVPPAAVPAAPADEEGEAAEPAKAVKSKISAKSFGRDPFEALIVEAEAVAAAPATDTGAATGGTAAAPADMGTSPGSGSDSGSEPGAGSPEASSSHSFKVVSVAPDNSSITVKVDGEVHRNLKAGDVFATYFKVRLISGAVNSFQYGEETFNVAGDKRLTIA